MAKKQANATTLATQLAEADREWKKLRREREAAIEAAVKAATVRITAELDAEHNYPKRIEAVQTAYWTLHGDLNAALVSEARAKLDYPEGTRMDGWKNERKTDYENKWSKQATGIIEVVTPETVHPESWADYSRAKIGEVVIRLLKKNGEASLMYACTRAMFPLKWIPEGSPAPKNGKE